MGKKTKPKKTEAEAKKAEAKKGNKEKGEKSGKDTSKTSKGLSDLDKIAMQDIKSWKKYAEDLKNLSIEQAMLLFKKYVVKERKKKPTLAERMIYKRALRTFKLTHKKKKVGSSAVAVGKFLTFKGHFDNVEKRRLQVMESAKLNPKKALKDGTIMFEEIEVSGQKRRKPVLDEHGEFIPRDNYRYYMRKLPDGTMQPVKGEDGKYIVNKNFGNALPEKDWNTVYHGIFSVNKKPPKLYIYKLKGKHGAPGALDIPMDTPVSFRCFEAERPDKKSGLSILNGFVTPIKDVDEDLPSLFEIYKSGMIDDKKLNLSELEDWCSINVKNYNDFFVAEVNVLEKGIEKTSNNSFRMIIDDDNLEFEADRLGYNSLNSFVSDKFEEKYNSFGELSRLVILATASQDWKKDENGKPILDDDGNKQKDTPVVNIIGFDIDPEYHEEPNKVEEMKEDDLDTENIDAEPAPTDLEVVDDDDDLDAEDGETELISETIEIETDDDDEDDLDAEDIADAIASEIAEELETIED